MTPIKSAIKKYKKLGKKLDNFIWGQQICDKKCTHKYHYEFLCISFKIILWNRSQRIAHLPSDIYVQFSQWFVLHYPKK